MSYLKFDKSLLINLDDSLQKEMLRTNKSGAYHCTTLVDCNTRKQHGLLVIPIPELSDENHVLLSSLDETVIQHGAAFNLGLHRYRGGCYSPNGHKYIREFDCESMPKTTYRVGGVVLTKEKVFISHENRILIKYTLLEAHSPTTLQLRPFLAFRSVSRLCTENNMIDRNYNEVENGISSKLYCGYPTLYMQCSKKAKYVNTPNWYNGIEYLKDMERGVPYTEDLYVPGYFELSIKKGESVIFSAGTSEAKPRTFSKTYDDEIENRTCRTSFKNCLKNSAEQLYNKINDKNYIVAGYPWFKIRSRDQFIALPGCTLAIGKKAEFESIMDSGIEALRNYMHTGATDKVMQEIELPDIPLWAIRSIQHYSNFEGINQAKEKYSSFVAEVLNFILDNKHHNLCLQDNGLLYSSGKNRAISWMNATSNGNPVIPRSGYLVEFNALWYNNLMFGISLFEGVDEHKEMVERWKEAANTAGEAFKLMFLNQYGYLYDYVDGNYSDLSVRPSMLIAISFDYSPLNRTERKGVLDVATRELLTPKGLRTLSPKSFGYSAHYVGSPEQRDYALHQGTVRPWLMGPYADAYFRVFGLSGVSFIERMLIGFEDEMAEGCIGSLSELYDGNPPFTGHGAISYAMNVGEVLRLLAKLKGYISLQP